MELLDSSTRYLRCFGLAVVVEAVDWVVEHFESGWRLLRTRHGIRLAVDGVDFLLSLCIRLHRVRVFNVPLTSS